MNFVLKQRVMKNSGLPRIIKPDLAPHLIEQLGRTCQC